MTPTPGDWPPRTARERRDDVLCLSGFGRPFGLARDADGRLLVADMDLHGVCRFSAELDACQWLRDEGGWSRPQPVGDGQLPAAKARAPRRFNGPHSVCAGPDRSLYVTTYYEPAVHVVPDNGMPGACFGRAPVLKGSATGHFDDRDRFLVTEYALHGVFAFSPDGARLGALGGGQPGFGPEAGFVAGDGAGSFDRPHMCKVLAGGELVVADTWNHRLQRFSPDGHWLAQLGGGYAGWCADARPTLEGSAAAAFRGPVAVSGLDDGSFLVTDWGNNRVLWFDKRGMHKRLRRELDLDRPYDAQVFDATLYVANSHRGRVLAMAL